MGMVFLLRAVAFKIYDMDGDGYISNGELFQVLKMMVGNNLKDTQLQQIVDKTIINADTDGDGKISFEEFCAVRLVFYSLANDCLEEYLLSCVYVSVTLSVVQHHAIHADCRARYCFTSCGPHAGSGVVRIDPLYFLAGYCTRRLNQV